MDKYIYRLIREQFNINDIDFSNDDMDANIFNKDIIDPKRVCSKILNGEEVYEEDIMTIDHYVSYTILESATDMRKVIKFYSNFYQEHSLNWIDTSRISTMKGLFIGTEYNGDISKWDTSNVTDMSYMFKSSKFNGDISKWDTTNVTDMNEMFNHSVFNGDISEWDVSNVQTMFSMFADSKFNQDISRWDVSNVKIMTFMFTRSSFRQNISGWNVSRVKKFKDIFNQCNTHLSCMPKKFRKLYQ